MTTFGEVVDRVYRDWLHGPDEQPIVATLSTGIDDTETGLTLDTSALTPDEVALLSEGTLIEIGYEQMRVTSIDPVTVVRGRNGTTAVAHSADDDVTLLPQWGRQTVLDAVLDEVTRLYPDLHNSGTTSVVTDTAYVEVPAEVVTITRAYSATGSRYYSVEGIELLTDFDPSSTGKAVQFQGIASGKTVYLAYRGEFTRPDEATDTLATFGVPASYIPILCVGAAAAVIASEDVDKATVEFVTRQLEAQQFPVGSSARLRDGMLRYRQYLIEQARRAQRSMDHTAIQHNTAVWP